jgi:hypothetical protein
MLKNLKKYLAKQLVSIIGETLDDIEMLCNDKFVWANVRMNNLRESHQALLERFEKQEEVINGLKFVVEELIQKQPQVPQKKLVRKKMSAEEWEEFKKKAEEDNEQRVQGVTREKAMQHAFEMNYGKDPE